MLTAIFTPTYTQTVECRRNFTDNARSYTQFHRLSTWIKSVNPKLSTFTLYLSSFSKNQTQISSIYPDTYLRFPFVFSLSSSRALPATDFRWIRGRTAPHSPYSLTSPSFTATLPKECFFVGNVLLLFALNDIIKIL